MYNPYNKNAPCQPQKVRKAPLTPSTDFRMPKRPKPKPTLSKLASTM